jgi:hypothetical protein
MHLNKNKKRLSLQCYVAIVNKIHTYSAAASAIGTLVVNTLASSLLLSCVAIVLPKELVDMGLRRLDNLIDRLHLSTLTLPLLVHPYIAATSIGPAACIDATAG